MSRDRGRDREGDELEAQQQPGTSGRLSPGKRTLTQSLIGSPTLTAPGQPRWPSAGDLPAAVQTKMEASFGTDFSSVRVVPSSAEASGLGAAAFARGNEIHFAPGQYDPESTGGQQLIGHELAHVVQQRAGRASPAAMLAKGLAVVEDIGLELEADAAGARAAAGEPAGITASGDAVAAPVLQGYFVIKREDFVAQKVTADGDATFDAQQKPDRRESYLKDDGSTNIVISTLDQIPALRVSADGKLAIEDASGSRQMKTFFIDAGLIEGCNTTLAKAGSAYELVADGGSIKVPDAKGALHTLVQVVGKNRGKETQGNSMTSLVNCDEMAGSVAGWKQDADKRLMLKGEKVGDTPKWGNEEGHRAAKYATEYARRKDHYFSKHSGSAKASQYAVPEKGDPIMTKFYVMTVTCDDVEALKVALKPIISLSMVAFKDKSATLSGNQDVHDKMVTEKDRGGTPITGFKVDQVIEQAQDSGKAGLLDKLNTQRDTIAQDYSTMIHGEHGDEVARKLGINEYAAPEVGDSFVTFSTGAKRADGVIDFSSENHDKIDANWGQHWGGVVAMSGGDWITLENYDRKPEDKGNQDAASKNASETRAFFQMYGAGAQSWHAVMNATGDFPNAISLAYRNKDKKK